MASPPSSTTSRRRTFDLPKSSPDAGLAEWTSRIKAIQQEVDRDEEAEQRRLQEEITRSRMERAKRRNTATGSIDWTKRAASPSIEVADGAKPAVDEHQHQSDALTKLAGSTSPKQEGVSLAAFMGGRASGPRLNKPAPQQDAHDATLFDQTRREGSHPVFGRANDMPPTTGRIALPGLSKAPSADSEKREGLRDKPDLTRSESKAPITEPASGARSEEKVDESTAAAKPSPEILPKPSLYRKPSNKSIITPGTIQDAGTPTQARTPPVIPVKPSLHRTQSQEQVLSSSEPPRVLPTVPVSPKPTSLAEMMGGRASGPRLNKQTSGDRGAMPSEPSSSSSSGLTTQGRALPGMTSPQPYNRPPTITSTSPKPMPHRPSSHQSPRSDTSSSNPTSPQKRSFSGGSAIVTPSLARPVQPQIIVQPSPVAASSTTASPAFLRPAPSTQDLHPSLSRLQGRGFVEQRVKASSEIFGGTKSQERERSVSSGSSGKRPTVLDRWQSTVVSSSPPPVIYTSKPANKGKTAEESPTVSQSMSVQQLIRSRTTSPAPVQARPPKIDEAKQEAVAPVRLPGMTPSTPVPRQWAPRDSADIANAPKDRSIIGNGATQHSHDKSSPSVPLSHPTRDRARKPRKTQGSSKAVLHAKSPERPQAQELVTETPRIPHIQHTRSQDTLPEPDRPQFTPPEVRRQPSASVVSEIARLKDDLTYQAPTSVKSLPVPRQVSDPKPVNGASSPLAQSRRALPGMTGPALTPLIAPRPTTPTSPSSSPEEPPSTPSRHSRIPSTGHRATVMDVAQALQAHEQHIRESSFTPEPSVTPDLEPLEVPETRVHFPVEDEVDDTPRTDVKAVIAGWGRSVGSATQQAERRRSTYDRYSVITLPPLAEEKTPAVTPQGSLSRGFAQTEQPPSSIQDIHQSLQDLASAGETPSESITSAPVVDAKPEVEDPLVHFEHQDRPPPALKLQSLLRETSYAPGLNLQTISVEVLVISGHNSTAVTREPNVFYDSEAIAVIHRGKEKTSGLVTNTVWLWHGKSADFGEREERKAQDLAERFGTTATHCMQGSEPSDLIHVLGGVLAVRQGIRAHFSVENTAMHRINRVGDSIFVDEIDLTISNLCSAYSYCLSILDALYVWHGRGASEDERKVASAYAQSLATETTRLVEFEEGAEDEMFWMMLGDDSFANADHWKFKNQSDKLGARLYTIESSKAKAPVQPISSFSGRDLQDGGVFVVDCRLELYIVVTPQARGKRADVQLGLFLAENIAAMEASKLPFDPPIHVIILPSQLPLELKASIRLCDEEALNGIPVPNHMNLLPLAEALDHMQRRSWPKSALSDSNFLPLGVDPSMF